MKALSCMIYMVGLIMFMSVSGLHSFRFIWTNGNCSGSCSSVHYSQGEAGAVSEGSEIVCN